MSNFVTQATAQIFTRRSIDVAACSALQLPCAASARDSRSPWFWTSRLFALVGPVLDFLGCLFRFCLLAFLGVFFLLESWWFGGSSRKLLPLLYSCLSWRSSSQIRLVVFGSHLLDHYRAFKYKSFACILVHPSPLSNQPYRQHHLPLSGLLLACLALIHSTHELNMTAVAHVDKPKTNCKHLIYTCV